ncbi:MAG: hypothetical protein AB3N34_01725 [Lettuce witches'-broom phytoplasma]
MVNKSFKQNSLIKYTSILLMNLILVLSMGATNIFGAALSQEEKKSRVEKAVEAAKTERNLQIVSDQEVTDTQLKTAAEVQANNIDDAKNAQEEINIVTKKVVTDYKTARDQIIATAVEAAKTERTTQKLTSAEATDEQLKTEATTQASKDTAAERIQSKVTEAAKKFVINCKENKIKDAIAQGLEEVILNSKDQISALLSYQLGEQSVYDKFKDAATIQANKEKDTERTAPELKAAVEKVANRLLNEAITTRDDKVTKAINKAKMHSTQHNHTLSATEISALRAAAKKQAEKLNEADNKETEVEKVVVTLVDAILKTIKDDKDAWVAEAIKHANTKAIKGKKQILTQKYKEAAVKASNLDEADLTKVTTAAETVVDNQEEITTNTTGTQQAKATEATQQAKATETSKKPGDSAQTDVSTVVKDDLDEQSEELTNETAKTAVEKQYPSVKDHVDVTVDTTKHEVTVTAKKDDTAYKGSATVKYTVKATEKSKKPWYKSVILWVVVGSASAVAVVGVVYYLNKKSKK